MEYQDFIRSKVRTARPLGFEVSERDLPKGLRDWQSKCVAWALKRGRAALFQDTGLGKTFQQLAWADAVCKHTGGPVVIHTPVGVRNQTQREAAKFSIETPVAVVDDASQAINGINLINYEKLHKFDSSIWSGVVLDESQILKNFTGSTKQLLINSYANTRYRLACTATPAPNDHMELGNHADFLGVMPSNEMLSRWFINDTMKAGGYRLKKHAQKDFWRWVTSWSVCLSKPSDMGGDDTGYILPELSVCNHIVRVGYDSAADGFLFDVEGISATNIHKEKRRTNEERSKLAADIAKVSDKPVLVWCYTDYESKELVKAIPGAVEVRGSMPDSKKQDLLFKFANGEIEILVTKPSIAGVGLNFQVCNTQIFASLSFSFQEYYQAVRRSWRFGQQKPVKVHIIGSEADANIEKSIARKGADHGLMQRSMAEVVKQFGLSNHCELMRERIESTGVPVIPSFLQRKAVGVQ
jgi:superfamily II DNA or RNA helicase